jgi:glutaredoxin 2
MGLKVNNFKTIYNHQKKLNYYVYIYNKRTITTMGNAITTIFASAPVDVDVYQPAYEKVLNQLIEESTERKLFRDNQSRLIESMDIVHSLNLRC